MTEKMFSFGVDIPESWKQIHREYERRFTDLEGFLDEDYDGEHHMLWDNQKECWCHLDDALCLMEQDYYDLKKEKEQLKQQIKIFEKFFEENDLSIDWFEFCELDECAFENPDFSCKECIHLKGDVE